MVPVAVATSIVVFVAPLNCTTTVSSNSATVSPVTDTVTDLLVSPGAKVRVPAVSAV